MTAPRHDVRSPSVGVFAPAVTPGALVRPGDRVGRLTVLGVAHDVRAPDDATGLVVGEVARGPVGFGTLLCTLDPMAELDAAMADASGAPRVHADGLAFRAPTSGRFYSRPGPGKPVFLAAGDVVREGTTVCLLEVMKTFNRVTYAPGDGLPAAARVVEVVAADESDVDAGAVLLRLEALP